jgi:MOSC domain-containing protein YiiM
MQGEIISINISKNKGTSKRPVPQAELTPEQGVVGDSHGDPGPRQVSLMAQESIDKQKRQWADKVARHGAGEDQQRLADMLVPGAFAENLTTRGIDLVDCPVGTRLRVGTAVVLEVTQIGKECVRPCAIYYKMGDCIFPREGIFARVVRRGVVRTGDPIIHEGSGADDQ